MGTPHIVKISVTPNLIYRSNAILIHGYRQTDSKVCGQRQKTRIVNAILKKSTAEKFPDITSYLKATVIRTVRYQISTPAGLKG